MASVPTTPQTVVRLTVDAFKRLKAARVTPSPTGLIEVRGRNRQGKSSLLQSMLAALGGKDHAPEHPIHEGAHGSEVVVEFPDLVVTKHWKRDSGGKAIASLTVTGADGVRIPSPQKVLDTLVGKFADPVAFLDMKAEDQVKTVLAVLGLDAQLRELEERAAGQFELRRDLGRDADRLTKAEQEAATAIEGVPAPAPVDGTLAELTGRLEQALEFNAAVEALETRRETIVAHGQKLQATINKLEADIENLKKEKATYTAEYQQVVEAIKSSGEKIDVDHYRQLIANHEINAAWNAQRANLDRIRNEAAAARDRHTEADKALGDTRMEIAKLLGSVQFPVEGMSYDHETKQLTINGIPFSEASQSERIDVSAIVAMAGEPTIRVMFVRDGSLLDSECLARLTQHCEARGFQLWCEIVDDTPEGSGIWIDDGEAYQSDPDFA